MLETGSGTLQLNPNMPLAYQGRVSKTGNATLVIKNVTFDDTTKFTFVITAKTGNKEDNSVQLSVTGTIG